MLEFLRNIWHAYLSNVVDILIVAYIFYRLLLLVKGTRAILVLRGVLVLAFATFLVNYVLPMKMMGTLLKNFWIAGGVILVIVFQPEIRGLLAQIGSGKFSSFLVKSRFAFIDEVIEGVRICTQKRLGALIVFQQETGLKNFIETGTTLNAEVTGELIISILNPGSPLHDGAIIIQDERIVSAGCVLPLSDSPHLSKLLGTRHRAALGLSEVSDALIIVVSEETGIVSFVQEGRMEREIELEDLRSRLLKHYRAKERTKTEK